MNSKLKIQEKWKDLLVLGCDAIVYSDGRITIGNHYSFYNPNNNETTYYWSPLCDTILENIEKYDEDIWTYVDIWRGELVLENQKIVFGPGSMGNEGFVASTKLTGELNWSVFFTFSNPICKAEIIEETLICYGDTGCQIKINLNELHEIKIKIVGK